MANPPKEPITTEITDASDRPKIAEDKNLSTPSLDATKVSPQAFLILCNPHSSLINLLYQIPPEKTSAQEQRSNNPTVEDDPVDADTQTIDSQTQ